MPHDVSGANASNETEISIQIHVSVGDVDKLEPVKGEDVLRRFNV